MSSRPRQFGLAYLAPVEAGEYLAKHDGHVLGVIGFGHRATIAHPSIWVDIPVLGEKSTSFEVWTSNAPVTQRAYKGIDGASDGEVLFASLSLEQRAGETLEMLA